jgi:hypothetical protein
LPFSDGLGRREPYLSVGAAHYVFRFRALAPDRRRCVPTLNGFPPLPFTPAAVKALIMSRQPMPRRSAASNQCICPAAKASCVLRQEGGSPQPSPSGRIQALCCLPSHFLITDKKWEAVFPSANYCETLHFDAEISRALQTHAGISRVLQNSHLCIWDASEPGDVVRQACVSVSNAREPSWSEVAVRDQKPTSP